MKSSLSWMLTARTIRVAIIGGAVSWYRGKVSELE